MSVADALDRMAAAGVTVEIDGEDLLVDGDLTEEQTQWLRAHKQELLAELGSREGAAERAAIHELDGELDRPTAEAVAALHQRYLNHLMGPGKQANCCFAPAGRLCPEGQRLRDQYVAAADAARPVRRTTP